MLLPDVNIYVHAHREDSSVHAHAKAFLERMLSGSEAVGYSPLALSGFVRIVTHPKVFKTPSDLATALEFCRSIIELPGIMRLVPGPSHWPIFEHLLHVSAARGNIVPDAWFAALAIEHDCTWVTSDRDYARFPGLRVRYLSDGA